METVSGCKTRVYAFEKEIEENLKSMHKIEEDIVNLSKLRSSWLDSISRNDDFEIETVTKRLDLLRCRVDTYLLEMQMDGVRLEGFYEAQQLKYMVLATSPIETGTFCTICPCV